jgi:hypothetical protein
MSLSLEIWNILCWNVHNFDFVCPSARLQGLHLCLAFHSPVSIEHSVFADNFDSAL